MKKRSLLIIICIVAVLLFGCSSAEPQAQIVASTLPVYEFTSRICQGTDITVSQLVTESVSCLHDYSLKVTQMRAVEACDLLVISGAGLESFLQSVTDRANQVAECATGVELLCPEHHHDEGHSHSHDQDPHFWLDPANAKIMADNICIALSNNYPQYAQIFQNNCADLKEELDTLQDYGRNQLSQLSCRELITFHDGFAYFAQAFDLHILKAVEEESGSEASASELKDLIALAQSHKLPAIFTEVNGALSAPQIIARETGCRIYTLDMAMSGNTYFQAMYHNIDTIKEALG